MKTSLKELLARILEAPLIVEQGKVTGTDGDAWYVKWSDGRLEVNYALSLTLSSYTTYNIGGLYMINVEFNNDLGVEFVGAYSVVHDWNIGTGISYSCGCVKRTTQVTIYANANSSGAQTCIINVQLVGKWK